MKQLNLAVHSLLGFRMEAGPIGAALLNVPPAIRVRDYLM